MTVTSVKVSSSIIIEMERYFCSFVKEKEMCKGRRCHPNEKDAHKMDPIHENKISQKNNKIEINLNLNKQKFEKKNIFIENLLTLFSI